MKLVHDQTQNVLLGRPFPHPFQSATMLFPLALDLVEGKCSMALLFTVAVLTPIGIDVYLQNAGQSLTPLMIVPAITVAIAFVIFLILLDDRIG